jgi:drug/metabolite transporter (DMT)-like permease
MPPRWKVWTALGIVDVVWGSTYLAIAYVVDGLPPLLTAAARFCLAAAMLGLIVLVRKGPTAFHTTKKAYLNAGGIGLLLLLGGNGGVMIAEDRGLPSGLTALLIAVVPLYVVLLRILFRDRPTRRTITGIVLGFAGLAVLLLPGTRPDGVKGSGAAIVLTGSLLWALGSVLASRIALPGDRLVATAAQILGGAIGLTVVGFARGEGGPTGDVPLSAWIAFAYLVTFGTVAAFTAYSWLLSNVPVSKAATYAYVNPVVAVALGAVILNEHVTGLSIIGGLITVVAVAVVVSEAPRVAVEKEIPGQAADNQELDDLHARLRSADT